MADKQLNRVKQGQRAGLIGIIVNLLLASTKLLAGILSASMAIVSDALNNLSDGVSSVITMIGFKLSQKPADSEHPYGHARFEYVASFVISFLVLFVGFELAKSSIEKIITPEATTFSALSLGILVFSIFAKVVLSIYNGNLAKKLNTDTLKATSIDSRNDAIITTCVLIAFVVEYFTGLKIDGYMGLAVALFIFYSGVNLIKDTISPLLGKNNNEQIKNDIIQKMKEYPIVISYHDLMVHDYGHGATIASVHFEIDKNHDPMYVHEIIDKFEREFMQEGVTLTVHYDPVITDSEELNMLKHKVVSELVNFDTRLSVHDFRCINCDGFTKVFMDIPVPIDMKTKDNEIKKVVQNALCQIEDKVYEAEITFDSEFFN
ncbi:MAG: cation transporter [Clostridia bacterium]|nr:cation transporter [Clostridia bacterium]